MEREDSFNKLCCHMSCIGHQKDNLLGIGITHYHCVECGNHMCPPCYKANYYNEENHSWDESRFWWSASLCHKCGDRVIGPMKFLGRASIEGRYRRWLDGKEKGTSNENTVVD